MVIKLKNVRWFFSSFILVGLLCNQYIWLYLFLFYNQYILLYWIVVVRECMFLLAHVHWFNSRKSLSAAGATCPCHRYRRVSFVCVIKILFVVLRYQCTHITYCCMTLIWLLVVKTIVSSFFSHMENLQE